MIQYTIRTMQQDLMAALTKPPKTEEKLSSLPAAVPEKSIMAPPPPKLPFVPGPPATIKPLLRPIAIPAPPILLKPTKPILKDQESKILLEEGWSLYKNKSYLDALEKFEKASILPTSWWIKFKTKKAIKVCQKQINHLEEIRQEEQKKLEMQLRAKMEEKIKQEGEAKLRAQKEAEERTRLEEKTRLEAIPKPIEISKPAEILRPARPTEIFRPAEVIRPVKPIEISRPAEALRPVRPTEVFRPAEVIRPVKPIEISRPAEALRPVRPTKISFLKIAIPALIVLLSLGLGIYWLSYKKVQPVKPVVPVLPKIEIVLPAAYFYTESTEIISLKDGQESKLTSLLEKIIEQNQGPGTFRRIIIKKTNGEEKILALSSLFKILKINPPGNFLENVAGDYMLFLYNQKGVSPNPFYAGLGESRLGIIIKTTDNEGMREAMRIWENNNMSYALSSLFLNKAPLPAENEKFQEDSYKSFLVRYLHSPNKYLSINYALIRNGLLITTSQESAYSTIDRLLLKNE